MSITCKLVLTILGLTLGSQAQTRATDAPADSAKKPQDAPFAISRNLKEQKKPKAHTASSNTRPARKITMKISGDWHSLGRGDAPLILMEFTDYECPLCRAFHSDTFPNLRKKYIETGQLRFVSRDQPLDMHPHARTAAEAALCAGDQGNFWQMRDALISSSTSEGLPDLAVETVLKHAESLSLDMNNFRSCLEKGKHKAEIQSDCAEAASLQLIGTPTFVLGEPNADILTGVVIVGAQPYSVFDDAIQGMLVKKPK